MNFGEISQNGGIHTFMGTWLPSSEGTVKVLINREILSPDRNLWPGRDLRDSNQILCGGKLRMIKRSPMELDLSHQLYPIR
jgi:hypothetical protein